MTFSYFQNRFAVSTVTLMSFFVGCSDMYAPSANTPKKPKPPETVGEFDPAAGKQIVDNKVQITNPITGPLEALKPMQQQLNALGIQHAVNLFHASEGRYPKDLDEFMTRIVKENNIKLPTLTTGLSYEYDVANHQLVIVRDDPAENP